MKELPQEALTNDLLHRYDVSSIPQAYLLPDRQEEADLIEQARQGDAEARERLIYSCLYYVHKVAAKYTRLCEASGKWRIEYLDLVQIGNCELVLKLDAALASKRPCGYLRKAASGAIIDYCAIYEELLTPYACNGRYEHRFQTESLDQPAYRDESNDDQMLHEIIPEPPPPVVSSHDFTHLLQAIEQLPEKQREMVKCHHGIDCAPETFFQITMRQRKRDGKPTDQYRPTGRGYDSNYRFALAKLRQQLQGVYIA